MKKTISHLVLLMLITGVLFTACNKQSDLDGIEEVQSGEVSGGPNLSGNQVKEVVPSSGEISGSNSASVSKTVKKSSASATVVSKKSSKAVGGTAKVSGQASAVTSGAASSPSAVSGASTTKSGAASSASGAVSSAATPSAAASAQPKESAVTVKTVYKDGTYTKSGSYQSPAGSESITVTVTIKNDVVQSLSVTPNAKDATSQAYQGFFIKGINSLVVGKSVDSVGGFGQVNGSSLTGTGFKAAFASIKVVAK